MFKGLKFRLLSYSVAAVASLSPAILHFHSYALTPKIPNVLNQTRHYSELNQQNLSDKVFAVHHPNRNPTQFKFELKGYVFGLRMIRAHYAAWYDQARYTAYADIKTSGLGALLKKLEIWAVSSGTHNPQKGLRPDYHVQQNLNKKNRRVEMHYDNDKSSVSVNIVPRLGSQGIPPASPKERYEAYDTITAIMAIILQNKQNDGEICNAILPVFDSKQHYNLRMRKAGTKRIKFNGKKSETLKCEIYYEPVSGFDPEDLPDNEESAAPINVYMHYAPELDLYIPVRFTYKISAITAVIKVTDMEIITY